MRLHLAPVFLTVVGCSASTGDARDDAALGSAIDARAVDAAPLRPDAKSVACPPGLPTSFGNLGTVTATKNGPGSPAMFDSYNVFVDLQNNPRWFFAMNLYENRGIFVNGFQLNHTYAIMGDDTQEPLCSLCINLFADLDTTPGGPSLHMFAESGNLILTAESADQIRVSGRLEDIILPAIEIVYDAQSVSCGDDINDPACGNSICLNHHCGRQARLDGCETSIKSMTF